MPFNGSGVYSLPQAAFVASTTILSASVNSNFSDIGTALTTAYQSALNVQNSQIPNRTALSVLGRAVNTAGAVTDIVCGAGSNNVMMESASTITWNTIQTANIANLAVTAGKIAIGAVNQPQIAAGTITGSNISTNTIAGSNILTATITNSLAADMAQSTIKGRAAGAGTGVPQDLTVAQAIAVLNTPTNIRVFTSSGSYPVVTNSLVPCLAYIKGGGGGGGGSTVTPIGGGGGEGEEAWVLTTSGAISAAAVTIGAGGALVALNTNSPGGTGGTTSIGAVVTAIGGTGGTSGNVGGPGGVGGTGGTGASWAMPGDRGHAGSDTTASISLFASGGGKGGATVTAAGVANSGGGGGGGNSGSASGLGGKGIVTVIEFGAI